MSQCFSVVLTIVTVSGLVGASLMSAQGPAFWDLALPKLESGEFRADDQAQGFIQKDNRRGSGRRGMRA
ncbi:MAG: hypothetical protein ACFCVD_00775 [Nodosilinea sp.]